MRERIETLLATRVGYSRFRQRLFADDMGELRDEMLLSRLPSVQLIILDLHDADDAMVEQLFCACEQGRLTEVEQLLQKPLNPNLRHPARADGETALIVSAENGNLEVVRPELASELTRMPQLLMRSFDCCSLE